MTRSDVVIVGGGLGGLTAGAALARMGRTVLLLEQHYVPGGCATTFKRKDYLMEVGLHEMDGLDPDDPKKRIFDFLGLGDQVQFLQVPELYRTTVGGRDFVMPHGEAEARDYLCETFPDEAPAIRSFFKLITGVRSEIPNIPRGRLLGKLLLPLFPLMFPNIVKSSRTALGAYLDEHFADEDLKLLLIANLVYYHDDPATMSLLYFAIAQAGYIQGGGHFVKGGSQQLSNRLAEIIRTNGGTVLLGKKVTAIDVENGKVTGVRYRDALNASAPTETVESTQVVANAAVPLVCDLLPPAEGAKLRKATAGMETACSLLTIYIGFNRNLKELGSRHYSTFVGQDGMRSIGDFAANSHADYDRRGFVFVDYGQIDSGLVPEGKTFGSICCADYMVDWSTLGPAEYKARKKQVAEMLFERLDAYLPGARDAIEHYEVGTARTIQSYTLNPGGTPYGFAQIPAQAGNKRFNGFSSIRGLHFAGAWSMPGGGFTGAIISGFLTAQRLHKVAAKPVRRTALTIEDSRSVRFAYRRMIASDTFEIAFEKPSGFAARAGQYAFVSLDSPRHTMLDIPVRPLSIVSSPEENVVRFAMRVSDSAFKRNCLEMDEKDTATLYGPTGDFLLPKEDRPVVFLAGGIGITPILPMVAELRERGFPCETDVIYSARTEAAMAYRDELSAISHDNYAFHPVFTATQSRIDAALLKQLVRRPEQARFYIVGTGGFLDSMEAAVKTLGVTPDRITIDDFG